MRRRTPTTTDREARAKKGLLHAWYQAYRYEHLGLDKSDPQYQRINGRWRYWEKRFDETVTDPIRQFQERRAMLAQIDRAVQEEIRLMQARAENEVIA